MNLFGEWTNDPIFVKFGIEIASILKKDIRLLLFIKSIPKGMKLNNYFNMVKNLTAWKTILNMARVVILYYNRRLRNLF